MQAQILTYNVQDLYSVKFFADELNSRPDFHIYTNSDSRAIDILIFFDSRGVSSSYEHSIVDRIINSVRHEQKFLLVARPLEITTWMTLYNFMKMNDITPKKVVTNMGFVDFTPKKMSIIEKSLIQYNYYFSQDQAQIEFLEHYNSIDNTTLDLYVQYYPDSFKSEFESSFQDVLFLIINSPELAEDYEFSRPRPQSFFKSLQKGNDFNREFHLRKEVFDFKNFTTEETYDGVHYTNKGNELIFSALSPFL